MLTATNQQQLNEYMKNGFFELEQFGVDITENLVIHLNGRHFEIDATSELLIDGAEIIFKGNGANFTTIKFINCEQDTSRFGDTEVDVFEETMMISFEDVFINADRTLEIRFIDDECLSNWKNIGLNTAHVLIANEDQIHDEFMEWFNSYDVEGKLLPGDHVIVNRGYYTHHGIYIGNNKLIHYSGEPGTSGTICEVSLKNFVKNNVFWVAPHQQSFTSTEIIERAKSRLGEGDYNLIFNNCEHFCNWCCTGDAKSSQVKAVRIFGIHGLWIAQIYNRQGAQTYGLE
ncbi:lecithin retinol acyltransferase family protein [Caryophanon latum]|uniref:LRAT domain-containing protein n=1 Tax=Caryophanon latum TaxID=33977 RepID=A0A1C0Z202_9BACL|nr:lecithin retinol acyltransferase family protein [Caryophanon latum]OCS93459.1 hypothetical protein A6K76_05325 [Caryophanon latum]